MGRQLAATHIEVTANERAHRPSCWGSRIIGLLMARLGCACRVGKQGPQQTVAQHSLRFSSFEVKRVLDLAGGSDGGSFPLYRTARTDQDPSIALEGRGNEELCTVRTYKDLHSSTKYSSQERLLYGCATS